MLRSPGLENNLNAAIELLLGCQHRNHANGGGGVLVVYEHMKSSAL